MNNQTLLEIQLDRLQQVNRNIELRTDDQFILPVKSKRADLVFKVYADLAERDRYRKAINFLANDLLGGNQLGKRGQELLRAKKPMAKMLPDALLGTVARSVEFTTVTLQIDLALAKYLAENDPAGSQLTDATYVIAVRAAVARELLETQSRLVVKIGEEIESVVHRPFVASALKMCRTPAHMMGLGDLQDFLERGFDAFRSMRGADEFIAVFSQRESRIIEDIYTAGSNPFPTA